MERFGRRYTPAVFAIALLMLAVPTLFGVDGAGWYERAVILLVAAAPCALIISLPIAMASGIAGAGKRGILIKGGMYLEHLGTIKTIAFDKTGTLTIGRPEVTDVLVKNGSEQELLSVAAGLEQFSEHPLARAIVKYAKETGVDSAQATGFTALVGAGVKAKIGNTTWYIGKPDLFRELGLSLNHLEQEFQSLQLENKTVVLTGTEENVHGMIALQDTLRDGVREVIADLHTLGIRTVMLTGDNTRTAQRVAGLLGIDDVRANLKPDDKVAAVKQLQETGPVLMVGDGVNDAPALAVATCGMAMGAAGTDAAIEAADIALMADDLKKVTEALHLGRKARKVSLQNIVFSIIVLVLLIPAAVSGLISITVTVFAHEASELLAVANGLRAGRYTRT